MRFDRSTMLPALAWVERGWKSGMERAQRARRVILVVAAAAIVIGLVLAIRAHPEILEDLSWRAVALLAIVVTPVLIFLGAVEFVAMAAGLGASVTLYRALFVTVIGSAANFLPIPGAMMTRIAALKAAGASAKSGAQLTVLQGFLWMAMTMALGSVGIILSGFLVLGAAILLVGLILGAVTAGLIATVGGTRLLIARLIVIRFLAVFFDGIRVAIALAAIGTDIPLHQAMVFTLASSFGSALSLVPVGLGIREVITGALAPIVGIPIALGFAAAVIIRLADLAVLFVLTIVLGIHEKRRRGDL